jgi:hypothetical protein
LAGILVLNLDTSFAQISLKFVVELGSILLYYALVDPLKVIGRILHKRHHLG